MAWSAGRDGETAFGSAAWSGTGDCESASGAAAGPPLGPALWPGPEHGKGAWAAGAGPPPADSTGAISGAASVCANPPVDDTVAATRITTRATWISRQLCQLRLFGTWPPSTPT